MCLCVFRVCCVPRDGPVRPWKLGLWTPLATPNLPRCSSVAHIFRKMKNFVFRCNYSPCLPLQAESCNSLSVCSQPQWTKPWSSGLLRRVLASGWSRSVSRGAHNNRTHPLPPFFLLARFCVDSSGFPLVPPLPSPPRPINLLSLQLRGFNNSSGRWWRCAEPRDATLFRRAALDLSSPCYHSRWTSSLTAPSPTRLTVNREPGGVHCRNPPATLPALLFPPLFLSCCIPFRLFPHVSLLPTAAAVP